LLSDQIQVFETSCSFGAHFNPLYPRGAQMTYSEAPSYIRWFWDSENEKRKTSWSGMEDFVTQVDNILETADEDCYGIKGPTSEWTDELFLDSP
jgi:hypothetical protein